MGQRGVSSCEGLGVGLGLGLGIRARGLRAEGVYRLGDVEAVGEAGVVGAREGDDELARALLELVDRDALRGEIGGRWSMS